MHCFNDANLSYLQVITIKYVANRPDGGKRTKSLVLKRFFCGYKRIKFIFFRKLKKHFCHLGTLIK